MTMDFTSMPPPEHWERFVRQVQRRVPPMPETGMSERDRSLTTAGTVATMISAAGDGLGANVPGPVGAAAGVATATSAEGVVNSLFDSAATSVAAATMGAEAGPFVGGFLMLARGTHQSLDRSDQMVAYLLGMAGYTTTLARCAVAALREATPYLRMPMPQVPSYVERTGDLYSDTRRGWFVAGYERAARVVREMDTVRPTSGDHYSKRCFIHLGMQSNMTGGEFSDAWRIRQRVEQYVFRNMLYIDLDRQREELRRWAASA